MESDKKTKTNKHIHAIPHTRPQPLQTMAFFVLFCVWFPSMFCAWFRLSILDFFGFFVTIIVFSFRTKDGKAHGRWPKNAIRKASQPDSLAQPALQSVANLCVFLIFLITFHAFCMVLASIFDFSVFCCHLPCFFGLLWQKDYKTHAGWPKTAIRQANQPTRQSGKQPTRLPGQKVSVFCNSEPKHKDPG